MTAPRAAAPPAGPAWHAVDGPEVLLELGVDPALGLSPHEARQRLARVGPNAVGEHPETPLWRLLLAQFRSLVVGLLLAAGAVAWALGERFESAAILAALLLNAAIGFGAEWRARRSLARLRALVVPRAAVRRGGERLTVASREVVPGDVILLEGGIHVPADARLLRADGLRADESALTGESAAVDKDASAILPAATHLAERRNMVYLGTLVLAGTGIAVVTATGVATELGRIGQLVALADRRATPLEEQMETLGRRLMLLALAICGVVGLTGVLHGEPPGLMLETAISLAVSAIPEGLPAVTSLALAAGLWRLARRGALVRRLPAVETLGSTTVICADKTGTMTENQMTVRQVRLGDRVIEVRGGGRSASGVFEERGRAIDPRADPELSRLLSTGALVNDADVSTADGGLRLAGDPTETALLVAALKAGLRPDALGRDWPRLGEIPFDPARRMMATFHRTPDGGRAALVKGAPGVVLEACADVAAGAGSRPLLAADREALAAAAGAMGDEGLRVLAVAWRPLGAGEPMAVEALTLLGLVGLADPERPGVREAIAACRRAGIATIMLTGDQRATAVAIGRRLGLDPEAVRSRVTPEGKLALVAELQAAGHIVAMTGDGINDAPALARADIGIAMGRHGTDVAREAADVVLTDDDFSTIARAVEEGRVIYANLRKVIHFLFSCNVSEILTIFIAILMGLPSPLLPLQILWVNLVTDILPAVALIRDPADPSVMRRAPRSREAALLTWHRGARILAEGLLLAAGVLSAHLAVVWREGPGPHAGTVAFVAIMLVHPLQAMQCRSPRAGWWRLPRNPLLWLALLALAAVSWVACVGPVGRLLGTVPLSGPDLLLVASGVLWPVLALEAVKARAGIPATGEAAAPRPGP
jgi:Ca2+-transporting ATPase